MTKKTQLWILCMFLVALMMSSCSKVYRTGTIVRDCTGTYLQLNNMDYLICNTSMTASFQEGSSITVKFNSKSCSQGNENIILCELYHKSAGSIEITEIK